MQPPERRAGRRAYRGVVWGLLALLAGVFLAWRLLPEWHPGGVLEADAARQRFRALAAQAGLRLAPGDERVSLLRSPSLQQAYRVLGESGDDWLDATGTTLLFEVSHQARWPGGGEQQLEVRFSLRGDPQRVCWGESDFAPPEAHDTAPSSEKLARLLLAPGESLGPRQQAAGRETRFALSGSRVPAHIAVPSGRCLAEVDRRVGSPTAADRARVPEERFALLGFFLLFLGVAAVFLVFALRAQLSIVNGALLVLAAELTVDFSTLLALPAGGTVPEWAYFVGFLAASLPRLLTIFLAWSVGESLLRLVRPETVAGLDAFRQGLLGRRLGGSLLSGFCWGAALAGFRLALPAVAVPLPGLSPDQASAILPPTSAGISALGESFLLAAWMSLAVAVGVRLLPARRALWAATVAGGTLLALLGFTGMSRAPLPISPGAVFFAACVVLAGVLSYVTLRFGLAGLLAASASYVLLPTLLLAARFITWWPVGFAVTAAVPLAILMLGWRGTVSPAEVGARRFRPPAFLARLEEERRLREMDLLARVQAGLLPREMPRVEGWEIAARSVLAHEAGGDLYDFLPDGEGRLWIAAGDVAGHGPSCAIALAMTKAALATLVTASRSPAEVFLHRVDHVLRAGVARRSFTTLALLRLDPRTGEAVLANAAHPYPLLLADGDVCELELPGLPLGQGPGREYREITLRVPPGGVLAFVSDGLLEAVDDAGAPFGFDAARDVLRSAPGRSAGEAMEALLAAWRRHLGSRPTADDTTVVVVKRQDDRMRPEPREVTP